MTYYFFGSALMENTKSIFSKYVFFSNSIDRCTCSSTDEGFLMKVPLSKTERFRKSYFNHVNRIVYLSCLWNSLPQAMRRDVN